MLGELRALSGGAYDDALRQTVEYVEVFRDRVELAARHGTSVATHAALTPRTMRTLHRRINALFVCSRNRWRSPTAEAIWRDSDRVNARSRGLSQKAHRVITEDDVSWADVIFVMERRHRGQLLARFGDVVDRHRLHVLDIPDDYRFMDPELVEELRSRAGWVLDRMSEEAE